MKHYDCIIIGAGIIGMSTARELGKRGMRVCLLDKKKARQQASWAAGGILSSMRPWEESPLSSRLSAQARDYYPAFTEALYDETGIDLQYQRSGLFLIASDAMTKTKEWAQQNQYPYQLNTHPPSLISQSSLLLPDIAQIRPPYLLRALQHSLTKYHVRHDKNVTIEKFVTHNRTFQKLYYAGIQASATYLIITAGAWSNQVLTQMGYHVNIWPVRGQMLCLYQNGQRRMRQIVIDGDHYVVPRQDGHILVGSTMENVGFDDQITDKAYHELLTWIHHRVPESRDATLIKHWSGLRPASDSDPYIGLLEGSQNIYLNSGHFRKGILQAPIAAKMIADKIGA